MMSCIALAIGMECSCPALSAASAMIQFPPFRTPTSRRRTDRRTPVHSLQLVSPWVPCTPFKVGCLHSVCVLPAHSRK
jgi:hypothetical protein